MHKPTRPPAAHADVVSATYADFSAMPRELMAHWMSATIEASDHALIFVDAQWRIEYWSRQAEKLLGWSTNTVIGKGLGSVLGMPPESSRRLRESFDARAPLLRERLGLRKAGGAKIELTVVIRELPKASSDDPSSYLVSLQDDVASRVSQEFQKFFYAVDQSMVGALIANPNGIVEYANPRAVEMLGLSPLELVGCGLMSRHSAPADSLDLLPEELGDVADWRGDRAFRHLSGQTMSLYVVASGIRDGSGRLINRVALFEDVTERRALEQAERELRDSLAHAGRLASLGEMATTIAHEINQPLAAIANYSQGALRRIGKGQDDREVIVSALEEISRQVSRASTIIQNVRKMARQTPTTMDVVDLHTMIQLLLPMLSLSAKRAGVRIEYNRLAGDTVVLGDETQLSQIVLNLAKNGIDAMARTKPEQRLLAIEITSPERAGKPGQACIAIHDHGSGIEDEHLEKIGTPFFTLKANGLGLGLSISRTLLEAHGSHLDVKRHPAPQTGMCFSFTLPIHDTHARSAG